MKKIIKIMFTISLTTMMLLSNMVTGYALESTKQQLSNIFIEHVDDMFECKEDAIVIDYDGNDITEKFFTDNYDFYLQKDYNTISNYFDDNINFSSVEKNYINDMARSPFVDQVVNKSFTVGAGSNISGTITYTISGSFTWDRATGKITSIGNATMQYSASLPQFWRTEVTSMSTNKSLSSDRYYATFSGNFKLKATFAPIKNVPLMTADLGPFSGSVTAHPEM